MTKRPELFEPTFEQWQPSKKAVAVLMSGGVDSSVTALLLRERGWDAAGFTIKIPQPATCTHPRPCCGSKAAFVCREIGIPHYFIDATDAFQASVIEPFRRAYRNGRTPSPCIDCNTFIKFGMVWDLLEGIFGIKHIATGHYAKVQREAGQAYLVRGDDPTRDQSYFLYGISPGRLPDLLLPLGETSKTKVRAAAERFGLSTAKERDSMELCFAGEGDYRQALEEPFACGGSILDTNGNELGVHSGIHNFTIGQRKGLHVAAGHRLYVLKIIPEKNAVIVGPREKAFAREVHAERANLLIRNLVCAGQRVYGKSRSRSSLQAATITHCSASSVSVVFDQPIFAPAPGQHLVLYDESGRVVAGGVIQ